MSSEVWQFARMIGFFLVALVLWLRIVYLPGRTLERWEDRRVEVGEKPRHRGPSIEERNVESFEEASQ